MLWIRTTGIRIETAQSVYDIWDGIGVLGVERAGWGNKRLGAVGSMGSRP